MNNVEYSICSSKYVSIHISHRSYLTPQNGTSNITLTDPLMKAVFNRRKKIGSLEQEYSSGRVEWPVERPRHILKDSKEAIFTSSVVHDLRIISDYRTPENCHPKSNWGTPAQTRGCSLRVGTQI